MSDGSQTRLEHPIPPWQVERAIRLSYAQIVLQAVFGASTGGVFLIGFAMSLGAGNVSLGLMCTVPAYFVVFQFLAAWLIQRGFSRKTMTVVFSFVAPLCWILIASIPLLGGLLGQDGRLAVLISVIAVVTISAQFSGNARASWIGELIPAERRGRFFGYLAMFSGIIAAIVAVVGGRFVDFVSSRGLSAFTALFFFGCLFGLVRAALFLPQPDCPLPGGRGNKGSFLEHLRRTVANRPFRWLALVNLVVSLGCICGPFEVAYLLRDLGLSYFALGLLYTVQPVAAMLASPLCGRLVDRIGCRPMMVLGLLVLTPCAVVYLFIPPEAPLRAYWLLPWTYFLAGWGSAAWSVAQTTMMYKLSKAEGREVQFGAFSVVVGLFSAPMPLLGGWIVNSLQTTGWHVDLRLTVYLWGGFTLAAAALASRLPEPGALLIRSIVLGYFPSRLGRAFRLAMASLSAFIFWRPRTQIPIAKGEDDISPPAPAESRPDGQDSQKT